ncbi:MAG: hypothetical protein ACQEUT_09945 [Bacillota bacterium]
MKKLCKRLLAILICVSLIYSVVDRPTEQDFNRWLDNEYGISCGPAYCKKKDSNSEELRTLVITGSTTKEEYLLFNTVSKTFEGKEGKQTIIKAIGFWGEYFTIVEEIDRSISSG